ncbi:hypothetical protein QE432_001964 [Agrobacterium sp. SORGH_AS 745]|nr:hypothetical protein [Agrobacterium tumefaciens]MDQ1220383.1 hypothetical protein [Agrobacterium sp. SORGH_AS_0745]
MTHNRARSQRVEFRDTDHLIRLRRMRGLARLMDTALRIPGTHFSFGADSIIGLVPGLGDFAGAAISLYIVNEARRLGVPNDKLVKMLVNIGFDAAAGSVPLVGDLFDVYFKSNRRNLISFWSTSVSTIQISIATDRHVNKRPVRPVGAINIRNADQVL